MHEENEFLTNLSRAAHFGERSLLRAALSNAEQQHASRSMIGDKSTFRTKWMVCYSQGGDAAAPVNIDAGPDGPLTHIQVLLL